jgi:hypothetical protein
MGAYADHWSQELGDYLSDVPAFGDIERRSRRQLAGVLAAPCALGG